MSDKTKPPPTLIDWRGTVIVIDGHWSLNRSPWLGLSAALMRAAAAGEELRPGLYDLVVSITPVKPADDMLDPLDPNTP